MRRCISSGIPTPVSRTSTTTQPDSSLAARMPRAPPSGIAVTAFRISRMSASRSSKALPSTGGSASMSCVTTMAMPRRCASSRHRGAVISTAWAITAGRPTGPKATWGWRETNSWSRRTVADASSATSRITDNRRFAVPVGSSRSISSE